jgi:hypothetical protein
VFRQTLGITAADADWLRRRLLDAAATMEATEVGADTHGGRWKADLPVTRLGLAAVVRTQWIIRSGETFPRFVTCWGL